MCIRDSNKALEYKLPGDEAVKKTLDQQLNIPQYLWDFMKHFEVEKPIDPQYLFAQGLYGYTCFDAISFFDNAVAPVESTPTIPLIRYRLYQYVIAFKHFKDELIICENKLPGLDGDIQVIESLIRSKDVPV